MGNFSPLIVGSIFPNNVPVIRLVWPHEQFWGFNSRETNRKLRGTTWKMDEGEEKRAKERERIVTRGYTSRNSRKKKKDNSLSRRTRYRNDERREIKDVPKGSRYSR